VGGGEILLSEATARLASADLPAGYTIVDLGGHRDDQSNDRVRPLRDSQTVESHPSRVDRKLDVSSRRELAVLLGSRGDGDLVATTA
jgi:hypothetical protein